jgi:hypothetical protein
LIVGVKTSPSIVDPREPAEDTFAAPIKTCSSSTAIAIE